MSAPRVPRRGEFWRHYKGDLYEIVGTGLDADSGDAIVIYVRPSLLADPELYKRQLGVFLGSTDDHRPRFVFERSATT